MPSYAIRLSIETWIVTKPARCSHPPAVGSSCQICCRRNLYVCELHSGSEGTWLSLLMHVPPVELDVGLQLDPAENFQPSLWAMWTLFRPRNILYGGMVNFLGSPAWGSLNIQGLPPTMLTSAAPRQGTSAAAQTQNMRRCTFRF